MDVFEGKLSPDPGVYRCAVATSHRESEVEYLRRIEVLAHAVVEAAADEGWLAFGDAGRSAATPLRRTINELATWLRFQHDEQDGCQSPP
jgi:hypothetical protein